MTAYIIINLNYFEFIGIYNKLLPSINIKSRQKFSRSKYLLRKEDQFLINKRFKKQELNTKTNNNVIKQFTKNQIYLNIYTNISKK